MKWCQTCKREFHGTSLFCPIDGQPLTTLVILDDKYRLEAKIGSGGMGEVYRATHIHIDTVFAIKVLHSDLVSDPFALARFRQEAKATAQIRHLNAVAVTDFGVSKETGMVYLVMEFLEGENLRERMNRLPLTYQEVFWLLSQACEGIHAAHQKGIIHRDIKPDNIFITQDSDGIETVKVVDFGIAKLKRQVEVNTLTGNNLVIGTPYYMSPEQAQVQPLDARSDIYSLGVMTYEMLTGQVPFSDSSWISVVLKHVNDPVPPLRSLNPQIPEQLEQVVLKALAKKAEHRQQTARELALEFRNALRRHGLISDSLSGKTSFLFSNSDPAQRRESPQTGSTKAVSTDQRPEAKVPSNALPRYQTGAASPLPATDASSQTPGQVQFSPNSRSGSRLSPDIPEINQPIKSPDGYHTRKSPRPGELPKRDVVFPEAGPVLPINDTGPRYVTHQTPNQPGPADFHNNPTVSDLPESAVPGTPSLYLNDEYDLDPRPINQAATISD
ncbi:MAG TPA: protein kinase, partial [Acidobacteriota bacterium]|nr:protein kinase [Acidobacteriota bacterium]